MYQLRPLGATGQEPIGHRGAYGDGQGLGLRVQDLRCLRLGLRIAQGQGGQGEATQLGQVRGDVRRRSEHA
jgi:hypothetical protein